MAMILKAYAYGIRLTMNCLSISFSPRSDMPKMKTMPNCPISQARWVRAYAGGILKSATLNSWLHFFKPSEYAVEEEVRLLYEMNDGSLLDTTNGKWIYNTSNGIVAPIVRFPITKADNNFPLVLERIVLGPNLKERAINKEQLRLMIKNMQIKVTDDLEISFSTIDSYRK